MTDPGQVARLRDALLAAQYTVDGVRDALGPVADSALARGDGVMAARATAGGSPLETLIRLFPLQLPVPQAAADAALPVADAVAGGLLERDGDAVRAVVDIRPYGDEDTDYWTVSDHGDAPLGAAAAVGVATPPRRVRLAPDHVLGVGAASLTLASLTVRPRVRNALDLGTGCGVQALHLSRHAEAVTATDVNPRALALARLSLGLSGVDNAELVEGPFFEPVDGRRFDLVVSNPPFVISPDGGYTYRDSGHRGDDVCRRLVEAAPGHLAEDGWFQILANWLHVAGQDWRERVAEWVVPTGCDAWIVQRDVQDPAAYVEHWLRDSNETDAADYPARYEAWLEHLVAAKVEGVGFGWITLRASGAGDPFVRIEDVGGAVQQPLGPAVEGMFTRRAALRSVSDEALLRLPFAASLGTRLERVAVPSYDASGWRAVSMRLLLDEGTRPSRAIDGVGAEVVARCDGTRPIGEVLAEVGRSNGLGEGFPTEAVHVVRMMAEEGFLLPPPEV